MASARAAALAGSRVAQGRLDPRAGVGRYPGRTVEDARHRHVGDAGRAGDIGHDDVLPTAGGSPEGAARLRGHAVVHLSIVGHRAAAGSVPAGVRPRNSHNRAATLDAGECSR